MPSRSFPLPPLWHYFLVAFICGLFSWHFFYATLLALFLLPFFNKALRTPLRFVILACVFSLASFYSFYQIQHEKVPQLPKISGTEQICGAVDLVQTLPEKRLRLYLGNLACSNGQTHENLPGLCSWTWENAPLLYPLPGQKVCIKRHLRHYGSFANNGDQPLPRSIPRVYWRLWSDQKQGNPEISGEANWLALVRQKIFSHFLMVLANTDIHPAQENFPALTQGQAILTALLFGDRRFLSQSTINLFSQACLAHSLALSGQHLAVAGIFAFLLLAAVGYIRPEIFLWQPARVWLGFFSVPLAILYLWLGGAPASLIRATVMLLFFVFLTFRKITYSLMDILAFALAAILLFNPLAIFDIGLQMSALCIFVICLLTPTLAAINNAPPLLTRKFPFLERKFLQIFLVSFIIQIALLPLTLSRFHMAGLWFFMNIIWLPILGICILPFAAVGLVFCMNDFCKPLSTLFLDFDANICDLFLKFLDALTSNGFLGEPMFLSPHWSTFLAFIVLLFAFTDAAAYKARNRKGILLKFFLVSLLLLAVGPALRLYHLLDDHIYIEALDVGQAQSILLKFPGNNKIVIDGGGSKSDRFDPGKSIVTPIINDNSAPKLNAVINTHPDLDHVGGLFYLLDKYNPNLFHNGRKANSSLQKNWEKAQKSHNGIILARGDKIMLGNPANNLALEVLHPPREDMNEWKGNSASLVLRLVQNGKGIALFTGDAEKDTLKSIANSGQDITATVLFAPHHGSDRSLYGPFYNKAAPELVLVNCGFENRWNYPGKNLAKFLQAKNIPLLDTGNYGKIKAGFGPNKNGQLEISEVDTAKK